jgi:hypothetical protein
VGLLNVGKGTRAILASRAQSRKSRRGFEVICAAPRAQVPAAERQARSGDQNIAQGVSPAVPSAHTSVPEGRQIHP